MTNLKKSIEQLNYEYRNRFSLSVVSQRASVLKLMTDSLDVRKQLENLYETLRQAPMLMEEADFDFLGWADEARWMKPEEQLFEDGDDDNWVTMIGMQQLGDLLKEEAMFKLMDKAIEENIRALRKTLKDIYQFRKTHRWSKESYAQFYHDIYDEHTKTEVWKRETQDVHDRWMHEQVGMLCMEDLEQKRRELMISCFHTGFLDNIYQKTHVPAHDDLHFGYIKNRQMVNDLDDTLKWVAAFKRLCPLKDNMFSFNEDAILGKYIYHHAIPQQTCWEFFHFANQIELVQTEMGWMEHPETKPKGESEVIRIFVDTVKLLMMKATKDNSTHRTMTPRGHSDSYIYNVEGERICLVMDILQVKHEPLLRDYLQDATANTANSIKYVAPFIGYILDTHLFTHAKMPKKDLDWVFKEVYGKNTSAVKKLNYSECSDEAKRLFEALKNTAKGV